MTQELWLCKNRCGYALGVIRRAGHHSVLDVFRQSQPAADAASADYVVIGLESGTLVCSHCQCEREWHMSEYALSRLLARKKSRSFGLVS
jgi:hypothetical protein